ncbi:MAG: 4-(cytidine 5'-diphospho)-2-C-methyl-D-erythritol kinase [Paludibacteraceae bacterium]|nr:4-(cytidine 5'-diphospho)-2-C-methyl-D-erythritol kinase [Paludibacteraceae bacterium]
MKSFPNCKINIGLNIVRKREDGYHDLCTAMYPIPLADELEIEEAEKFSFETKGIKLDDDGKENLVVRAYRMMEETYGTLPPVKIMLTKNIPSGAGLGGGSADAAFTIKMINEMFKIGANDNEMEKIAAKLGADCAFFIKNKPRMCKGKGDQMSDIRIDLSGKRLIMVKPDINISTKEAYAGCHPQPWKRQLEELLTETDIKTWQNEVKNDFERQIFINHRELEQIKREMYEIGACYASMSGSGSTIYGIFETKTVTSSFTKYKTFIIDL